MDTVKVLSAGSTYDELNDKTVFDWSNPTSVTVEAMVEPTGSTDKNTLDGNKRSWDYSFYLPVDVHITQDNRLEYQEQVFNIVGMPHLWTSPYTGKPKGVEVKGIYHDV